MVFFSMVGQGLGTEAGTIRNSAESINWKVNKARLGLSLGT